MAKANETIALRIRRLSGSNWLNTDFYQVEILQVNIQDPVTETCNVLANNKKVFYQSGDKYGQIEVTFRVRQSAVTLNKLKTVRNFIQGDTSRTVRIFPRFQADDTDYYVCYMASGQVPDRLSAHGEDRWKDKITVIFDVADTGGAVFVDEDQII